MDMHIADIQASYKYHGIGQMMRQKRLLHHARLHLSITKGEDE